MMEIISGLRTVCSGLSIGTIALELANSDALNNANGNSCNENLPASHYDGYLSALRSLKHLLSAKRQASTDSQTRDILECQLMALDDEELAEEVKIAFSFPEASARTVEDTYAAYARRIFSDTVSEYFALRAEDIMSLGTILSGMMRRGPSDSCTEAKILICDHVRLSNVLLESNVVGVVEQAHIPTTHASMLLKAQGIVAVDGIRPDLSWQGKMAIVNADRGQLILDPTEEMILLHRRLTEAPSATSGMKCKVPEGIRLLATVNTLSDAHTLSVASDSTLDVGLIRTEMLFLNRVELPDEDAQYYVYHQICQALPDRILTFRTFDFGGDKFDSMPANWKAQGITVEQKGVSGALAAEEDFRSQLRAILRLSCQHRVRILFPYITNSDQLTHIEILLESIYTEKAFGDLAPIEKGFMIESVSALAIANEVISRSDFVSVGTNDLLKSLFPAVRTQGYDDLGTNEWSYFADIIRQLSAAAHSARKPLILCGEVILDDRLRPFLDLSGIDGISLPTQYLTKV